MLFVVPPATDSFEQFWQAYPRRIAKKDARKAWDTIRPTPQLLETILTALAWQTQQPQWMKDDGAFVPYPASWLRAERWEDECPPSLRPRSRWCDHDPECVTSTEHTRRLIDDHRAIAETA